MSETDDTSYDMDADEPVRRDSTEPTDESTDTGPGVDADTAIEYLKWGALLGFVILTVVAGGGLYASLGSIIDVWVASEYRPFARTGLNLAVLAASVAGIVTIIRRL